MYLAWFDDNAKKKPVDIINEALLRYKEKFGHAPNVVLVNPAELVEHPDLEVRASSYVGHHNYWIGFDESLQSNQKLKKAS